MPPRISAFGSDLHSRFTITNDYDTTVRLPRLLWFDQDLDGRWLVWAAAPDRRADAVGWADGTITGAIIVQDSTVAAFIAQLGELLAHPERYQHESRFSPVHPKPDTVRAEPGMRRRRYANASEGDAVPPLRVMREIPWRALAPPRS